MKTYQNEVAAQKIADKLTAKKGVEHKVIQVNDGYQIVSDVPQIASGATEEQMVEAILSTDHGDTEVNEHQTAILEDQVSEMETVTFTVAGAKITNQYVITPVLGKRPRWFERKRLVDAVEVEGGVQITCAPKVLTSRGLKDLVEAASQAA
jgi:hypothetical protein